MPDSISVIRMRDVLLVTVPSEPDDETVSALQEKVLDAMVRHEPKGLILDITKIQTIDSFFARTISETSKMVGLMGGRTVIAGMRPSIAIIVTQLGLTFGNTMTALDVGSALDLLETGDSKRRL